MKRLLPALAALLMLAGCTFDAPLTEKPTRNVDPSLLGSWFSLSNGKPLDVYKLSPAEYLVIDDGNPYVCTHSDLGGTAFVSCKVLGNDKDHYGKYGFIAYRSEGDTLVIMGLNGALPITDKSTVPEVRAILEAAAPKGTATDIEQKNWRRFKKKTD